MEKCLECKGLFSIDNPTNGNCPAQILKGTRAAITTCCSPATTPLGENQREWLWWRNCQQVDFSCNRSNGACPSGGGLDNGGSFHSGCSMSEKMTDTARKNCRPGGEEACVNSKFLAVLFLAALSVSLFLTRAWAAAHASPVSCLRFSPGSSVVAAGYDDGSVSLWESSSSSLKRTWRTHSDRVHGVAFLSEQELVSWARDDTVAVTNLLTGQRQVWHAPPGCDISYGALSPTSATLATWGGIPTLLWDLRTGRYQTLETPKTGFDAGAFSLDGKSLAQKWFYSESNCGIVIFDTQTRKKVCKVPGTCKDLAFDSSGNILVLGSERLRRYDSTSGQVMKVINLPFGGDSYASVVCVGPGAEQFAVLGYSGIHARSVVLRNDEEVLDVDSRVVGFAGENVVVELPEADYVKLWELQSRKLLKKVMVPGTRDNVLGLPDNFAISPDGRTLARTGTMGAIVKMFRL